MAKRGQFAAIDASLSSCFRGPTGVTLQLREFQMSQRHLTGVRAARLIATLLGLTPLAAVAGPDQGASCFAALGRSGAANLECQHKAWLTPQEQADLTKLTRGYVKDARCTVTISVPRSDIDAAIAASDIRFQSKPQPVTCEIDTSGGPLPIQATFAPHVVFKDGFAVSASPGLANVTGVNSYLAWPVVEYVNRSATIGDEMVRMINAYRGRIGARQASR
jgi:hypothetical protein